MKKDAIIEMIEEIFTLGKSDEDLDIIQNRLTNASIRLSGGDIKALVEFAVLSAMLEEK